MRSTPEPEPLISLGLSAATPKRSLLPDAETLQFQKAETMEEVPDASTEACGACKRAFTGSYFWVNGVKVCSPCGLDIQAAQRAPQPHLFLKAFVWGAGAALAGTILYATVAIVTGIQFALISILIGYLVGKAIRHACQGRGGRPQQIMAVVLTYFSITVSYLPIAIHHQMVNGPTVKAVRTTEPTGTGGMEVDPAPSTSSSQHASPPQARSRLGLLAVMAMLLAMAIAAPFFALPSVGGLLSLLIFFGDCSGPGS